MRQRCHAVPGRFAAIASTRPGVGVGGDQQHPGQAAGDEVGEERVPGLTGLAGGDLDPEDLAVPVDVDPGRDQHDGVDDPAVLADLHRQRIRGDERERARTQPSGRVRNAVTCSSRSAAIRETCDFDKLVIPR